VEEVAQAVARREDEMVYCGIEELGIAGLLTAKNRHRTDIGDWNQVEQGLNDVLTAVGQLDDADFRGPFALALSPTRYNALFRRYEGSDMLQLDHLRRLCEGGVYKAPVEGGWSSTRGLALCGPARISRWAIPPTTAFTSRCLPARVWCWFWF
jgi:uncharacterized linocin/CFP29 family protein